MKPVDLLLDAIEWHEVPLEDAAQDGTLYATHEGTLEIDGAQLKCYQLNNGERVFDADSVARFFGAE